MNIHEVRLDRLRWLLEKKFDHNKAALARAIRRQPAQVSQWFSGVRKITETSARHIEDALGLRDPPHWLDQQGDPTAAEVPVPAPQPQQDVLLGEVLRYAAADARRQVLDIIRVQLIRARGRYQADDLARLLDAVDALDGLTDVH